MTDSVRTANATSPSRRSRLQPRVLEPRVLLDAAAVETAVAVAADAAAEPMPTVDASALFEAPVSSGRREAYVVDTSVEGYEGLLAAVPEGAELFLIDSAQSGLAQLNQALGSAGGQFDAIHIISHGAGGAFSLGADTVTRANVASHEAALQELGSYIAAQGDLLLYGCDIAGNADGVELLSALESLTGADVAASTDATGGPNGDAVLESWLGDDGIQSDPWAAVGSLAVPLGLEGYDAGEEFGDASVGTPANDKLGWAMDGSGDWIVAGGDGNGEVRVWYTPESDVRTEQVLDRSLATGSTLTFGDAVAIDGNFLVVADSGAGTSGKLYVYKLDTVTKLWSASPVRVIDINTDVKQGATGWGTSRIGGYVNDGLGSSQWLAISGNHIVVGAANEGGGSPSGRVALIAVGSSVSADWQSGTLSTWFMDEPSGYGGNTRFGASVAMAGSALVIGASGADTGNWADIGAYEGAVFVYTWTKGAVAPVSNLAVDDTLEGDGGADHFFGAAVDVEYYNGKYTVIVGEPSQDDTLYNDRGAVYIFQSGSVSDTAALSSATFGGASFSQKNESGLNDGERYGLAVAVSQGRALVGVPNNADAGDASVWLLTSANNNWSSVTKTSFTVGSYAGSATDDKFGRAVAFTSNSIFAVGAPQYGSDNRGAVVFYTGATDTLGDVAAQGGDQLGYAVDAYGEWVLAGGNGNAEVQIWRVFGDTRIEQKIVPPPGSSSAFGAAVSIEGNTFVVGDPNAGTAGKVFVYQLNTTTYQWGLVQTLDVAAISGWGTARIGAWADVSGGNQWLAVSENRIAVGAPNEGGGTGRVAWFADTSNSGGVGNWSAVASGFFDEPPGAQYNSDVETNPLFGASIAIARDALVIGAPRADVQMSGGLYSSAPNDEDHGAVFIYQWSSGSISAPSTTLSFVLNGNADVDGVQSGTALPVVGSRFGAALDVDYYNPTPSDPTAARYTIVVGAPGEDGGKGEVYIYQTTSNSLTAFAAASNIYGQTTDGGADRYGVAVAVSQGRIVVGAPNHDAATDAGVFFYEKADNVWTGLDTNDPGAFGVNVLTFTASSFGGSGGDRFGRGVAFSNGNNIAAGAPLYASDDRGAVAFFYARTPVAVNDSFVLTENDGSATFNVRYGTGPNSQNGPDDIYGSATGVEVIPVLPASLKGSLTWNPNSETFTYSPNGQFEYLSQGQTEVLTFGYQLRTLISGSGPTAKYFSTQASVTLTINGVNDAPLVDAGINGIIVPRVNEPNGNPSGAQTASIGTVAIPFNAFSDVDQADILTYSALSVTKISGAASLPVNLPAGKVTATGSYNKATGFTDGLINYNLTGLGAEYQDSVWQVTVQASDGKGGVVTTTFNFTIARDNQNPETQTIPNMAATEDAVFTYDFESDDNINEFGYFRDPDTTSGTYAERLTYSIVSQSGPGPDWLSISPDGVLIGAPSNENVGAHTVKLKVTDIFGNSIESNAFTITVGNTNDAPVLINEIDRKVSIKGETFSFNVKSGALAWGGGGAPNDDIAPAPYVDPNNFFYDIDNSTVDGRSPSSGDTITYTAYNAVDGTPITTTLGSGGNAGGTNDVSWLTFDGTSFTGTSAGVLGSTITIRLRATDNHGAFTDTEFEIGIFPRDGAGAESGAVPGPEYAAQMGYDVAINSGTSATGQGVAGKWAVVGAPGANTGSGYIYIYENTAVAGATPVWTQRGLFTTTAAYARLGTSVAISADGLRIVAGAPNEDTNAGTVGSLQGAVYFFQNDGSGVWSAAGRATAPVADANNGDRFGSAVAINEDGAVVLVGAPMDDEAGTNAGAAYAFGFGAATAGGKLLPVSDAAGESRAGDLFGSSVAFDQNMFVIGAPRDDHSGKVDAGSVYVVSTDSTWSTTTGQFSKLKKSALSVGNYDYFGTSVDVDSFNGRNSVVVVVGTPKDDTAGADAGAVYVFRSDTMVTDNTNGGGLTSLVQQGTAVKAYDASDLQEFGASVAVDVDELTGEIRMAVGSSLNAASSGAAYAYRYWGASGWLGQRYLPATTALKFGHAVDVAASVFIVGAPDSDRTQAESGKYYSFNTKVATSGQTPIEALSSATPIAKVADSGEPAPVILSSGRTGTGTTTGGVITAPSDSGFFLSLLGDGRDDEWKRLLRPVTDWSSGARDLRFSAAANSPLAPVSSYTDAVLFEQRTQADDTVLQVSAEGAPVEPEASEAVPAEGEQPATAEPETPLATLLKGFSTQLQAANDVRAREARQLLSSLGTLAG